MHLVALDLREFTIGEFYNKKTKGGHRSYKARIEEGIEGCLVLHSAGETTHPHSLGSNLRGWGTLAQCRTVALVVIDG